MSAKPRSSAPTETIQLTGDVKLEKLDLPKVLTIDSVMPRDLPKKTDAEVGGIHYIHFMDYWLDRDREDPIRNLMRQMEETISKAEIAILQMQENVDPTIMPSTGFVINLYHEDVTSFDQKGAAKLWWDAMIVSDQSTHERSKLQLERAKSFLRAVEYFYVELWHRKFKRRLEHVYKRRYGETVVKLYELERSNKDVIPWLRARGLKLETDPDGHLKDDCKDKEVFLWREKMIMDFGFQAELAYEEVRSLFWYAETLIHAVNKKAESYTRFGGVSTLRKELREQQRQKEQRQTSVQVVQQS